jgi:hypothetical protein
MSKLKIAAFAAVLSAGFAATAEAQPYGYWQGRPGGYGHYRAAPPVYVPPHIARKQAQLQERFVEKYGVVQPYPHYRQRQHWGHRPYGYAQPRPYGYYNAW